MDLCVLLFLPNNFTIIIRVLKIALATGAITGYYKVFAACKLLERSEKNGRLKKLSNKKRKRNRLNHDLYVLFCKGAHLTREHISLAIRVPLHGTHISLVICVPPPGKHVSLVIRVSLLVNSISLVICIPLPGKHISLVIWVLLPRKHIPREICSPN